MLGGRHHDVNRHRLRDDLPGSSINCPSIAAGACLANAVGDALAPLGVAVDATPMTPEAVLRLIQGASR